MNGDIDIYTIIFAALAVFIILRLRSVLGQRTGSERPHVTDTLIHLSTIAAVLCALLYVTNQAKWYSALKAAITPVASISGLARLVDGDAVVIVGILLVAMALLLGAAVVLSFLHWRDWKAQKPGQGDGLKKAKPLDGLLRDHPSQRKADDPPLPHQPSGSNRWRYPPRGPSPNFRSWPEKKPTAIMRDEFYLSREWRNSRARYQAIKAARGACQACGARKSDGVKLVVDHIKPVRHYWHLRFAADNLQVLCEPCNLGKGSWTKPIGGAPWRARDAERRPTLRGSRTDPAPG